MMEPLFGGQQRIAVRAFYLVTHIDVRALEKAQHIASAPLVLRAGDDGCVALFRWGAVILFGLDALHEVDFLASVAPFVSQPLDMPEEETVEIVIAADAPETQDPDGIITLRDFGVERLQAVADILGKSVALAHFEGRIAEVFERIEPLAARLRSTGRIGSQGRELVRQIGDVLLMQHHMVGRVEVVDKPEFLWERTDLDRLHARLRDEYELVDRHRAVDKKLALVDHTAQTVLDLLQTQRSLRVEWYIVALILVEIVILLYDLFLR